MRAMILAAGLGTRLQPLTNHTPKALLLVHGEPLITYGLRLLKKHRFTQVLINLHHLGELLEKELGDGSRFGMEISYSWEEKILGTGGGIKKVADFFRNEPVVVLNSDVLIDLDLPKLVRFHKKKRGLATMVVREREPDSPYTPIWVGRGDRILNIGDPKIKKKGSRSVPHMGMYTGVQILEPKFLNYLPADQEACLIRNGYQPALASGEKIFAYPYSGYWNDLGTFERLRQAEAELASGRPKLSFL